MSEQLFEDLPILGELGVAFRAGMARAEATEAVAPATPATTKRRTRARFGWLGTVLVLGLVGTTAAAATLTLLRGSPIPGPKAEDTQRPMSPRIDSLRVVDLRASDPSGGASLPFALRTGRSETGQTCATVGQVDGKDFGIVGDDGRFREVAAGIVDGCGAETPHDAAITGARVFDAARYADVRTVVYAAGAPGLSAAVMVVRGRRTTLPVKDGAFLGVLRGYPEDVGLQVRMRIGNRTVVRGFGTGPKLVLDPDGPAWQVNGIGTTAHGQAIDCVSIGAVRRHGSAAGSSTPGLCVRSSAERRRHTTRPPIPLAFDMRTLHRGDHGRGVDALIEAWRWNSPDRTVIWGVLDREKVRALKLKAPTGLIPVRITTSDDFGVVLPATVRVRDLRLVATMRNGTTRSYDHPLFQTDRHTP